MYDRHNTASGANGWQPPSPWDLLLGSLARIESAQAMQTHRLGGLETGQKITLDAVEKCFELNREIDRRMTQVEGGQEKAAAASRPEPKPASPSRIEVLTAFLVALKAVLSPAVQMVGLTVVGVLALKGALNPEEATAWLKSFASLK